MKSSPTLPHLLLALAVTVTWGTNFVVIRLALDVLPPLLFAALRFSFVLLPMVFFIPRPKNARGPVPFSNLAAYGLALGLGQFGLLFIAMKTSISPALASLVVQVQVFFTIGLSMLRSGERLKPHQLLALALAIAGLGIIMAHNSRDATILGVVLTLGAAAGWAFANQCAKEAGQVNALAYVVWASLFSAPPLYLLSFWREGWPAIHQGLAQMGPLTWGAVLWQSAGNTMFGYGCWAWLLARYPAATVAPLSLLVPVFGFAASAFFLGEPLEAWKLGAGALVLGGLAINLFLGRVFVGAQFFLPGTRKTR